MKALTSVEKVNIDRCLDVFDGNRFYLILAAATRAREIASTRNIADHANPKLKYDNKPIVSALLDVVDGKVGKEYLAKIAKAR